MARAMTAKEFIAYWLAPDEDDGRSQLSYWAENIAECQAENANEAALFGDSGPGSNYRLNQSRARFNAVVRQLERLGAHVSY